MNEQLLAEIIALIVQLGPIAVQKFLDLESVVNLGPDEKQNIANAIAAAKSADKDTIDTVEAWKAKHGLV